MKFSLMIMLTLGLFAFGLGGCDSSSSSSPATSTTVDAAKEETQLPTAERDDAAKSAEESGGSQTVKNGSGTGEKNASGDLGNTQGAPAVTQDDLLHRHFVLITFDGADYSTKERAPEMEFMEDFSIAGGICNRFTGQASLENGLLLVKQMASTKMLCADQELDRLETVFAAMLEAGSAVSFDGKRLVLKNAEHELVYELRDRVQ